VKRKRKGVREKILEKGGDELLLSLRPWIRAPLRDVDDKKNIKKEKKF